MNTTTNPKKTIKTCFILAVFTCLFCLGVMIYDYSIKKDNLYLMYDLIVLVIGIIVTITFFVFSRKTNEEIVKHRGTMALMSFISIFSSIIIMILAFVCVSSINKFIFEMQSKAFMSQKIFNNLQNIQNNQSSNTMSEEEKIQNEVDKKVLRIRQLYVQKEQHIITDEEFERLKNEILNS